MNASIEERLESIAVKEQKSAKQIAEADLLRLHPDFEDIRNDAKFHDWADEQPEYIHKKHYMIMKQMLKQRLVLLIYIKQI